MSFQVCLSHDIDRTRKTFQYFTHSLKSLKKGNIKECGYQVTSLFRKNPYWQFDRIIKLEEEFKVRSTMFFLNESFPFKIFKIKTWPLSVGYYNIESLFQINDYWELRNFINATGI